MTTLNPLRIDPRAASIQYSAGRNIAYTAVFTRDGVRVESAECDHPLGAIRDLVQRYGLHWVACIGVVRPDGSAGGILGILGDERPCADCNGEGMVTLFSTRGTCKLCNGLGVHLIVPNNLPLAAELL